MFQRLALILHPFSVIAKELTVIRELYELELSNRTPAIIRITEKPKRSDTEVTYMGDEAKPRSAMERAKELFNNLGDDNDD